MNDNICVHGELFLIVPETPDRALILSPLENSTMNSQYRVAIPEQTNANESRSTVGYLLKIEDHVENVTAYFSMVGAKIASIYTVTPSHYTVCTCWESLFSESPSFLSLEDSGLFHLTPPLYLQWSIGVICSCQQIWSVKLLPSNRHLGVWTSRWPTHPYNIIESTPIKSLASSVLSVCYSTTALCNPIELPQFPIIQSLSFEEDLRVGFLRHAIVTVVWELPKG